jgi:hypothetical protein
MSKPLWIEGLSDAIGFVGGALLGWAIARLIGLDPLAQGYETTTVFGIALVGLGGGMGLQGARRWRASRNTTPEKD